MATFWFLRQTATVVGTYPSTTGIYNYTATFGQNFLGTAGSRLIACQCVHGGGHGSNNVRTQTSSGTLWAIDVGDDDGTNLFSSDILIYDEVAGDSANNAVVFQLSNAGAVAGACAGWCGEYVQMDQSNYGYSGNKKNINGNVDYDASYSGTGTGTVASLTRSAGQDFNYVPEMGIWVVGGPGGITVSGANLLQEGYVSDGVNIWMAVQDWYVDATGKQTASWNLSASSYWNMADLTMKTLAFPVALSASPSGAASGTAALTVAGGGGGLPAGSRTLLGVGL